jgi:hypothetical protein
MLVLFIVLAALAVVAIGLVAVGGVSARLAQQTPATVFDMDEAVEYVAARLPEATTAILSFEDVAKLIGWQIDYLDDKGVAAVAEDDLRNLPAGPTMATDDEAVAYVLGRATDAKLDVTDVQVVQVLDANDRYLRAIGAVGPVVPPA